MHGETTNRLRCEVVQGHNHSLVEHASEEGEPQQATIVDMGRILDPFQEEVLFSWENVGIGESIPNFDTRKHVSGWVHQYLH